MKVQFINHEKYTKIYNETEVPNIFNNPYQLNNQTISMNN
jgi:hypothetical protein